MLSYCNLCIYRVSENTKITALFCSFTAWVQFISPSLHHIVKSTLSKKNGDGWMCDSTCLWNIDKCNTYAFTWVVTTQGATTCFLYNYNFCLCESIFTQGVDQRAITLTSCKLRSMRVFLPFSTNVMPPLLFQQITWFLATYHQYRE